MIRVLVEAYSCEPEQGSEKGVGWNVVAQLAERKGIELTVVTRGKNKELIEGRKEEWSKQVRWIFVEPAEWLLRWKKRSGFGLWLYHWFWGRAALATLDKGRGDESFDLVHRLTFGSVLPASQLAKLGLPMVVGPAGGGEMTPGEMVSGLRFSSWLRDRLRWGLFRLGLNLPSTRTAYENCAVGLGATDSSVGALNQLGCEEVRLVPQSGCGGDEVERYAELHPLSLAPPEGRVRLVCASRFIYWKGIDLAVEAVEAALGRGEDVELMILGGGPEESFLKRMVEERGLKDRVFFLGRLGSLDEVFGLMRSCDALIHPALNEAFGQVVLESLVLGRQVLCLDWQGPGMIVTESCGLKVPPGSREEVVSGLADTICVLRERRASWSEIQEAAILRARDFSWERLGDEIERAYLTAATPVRDRVGAIER